MRCLNEQEIVSNLINYVSDDRQKYAVLLDGEWGSGKTFFVKNILMDEIEKNFNEDKNKIKVIYISLYGITSTNQILEEICLNIVKYNKDILNNKILSKVGTISSKVFFAGLNFFNIEKESLPNLSDVINIKNMFIIFDDIERCTMNINDILGYINNLVEHNEIKVLLVANQEEIGKINLNKNIEDKYSIILSGRINFDNKIEDKNLHISQIKQNEDNEKNFIKEQYTEQELKEKTKRLFSDDLIYKSIKEKLIGYEIKYEPNLSDIFDKIIYSYIRDENTKLIIKKNKNDIIKLIKKEKSNNLRTLIFALISFENIYRNIDIKIKCVYYEIILDEILMYCIRVAIIIKSGKDMPKWTSDYDYKYIYWDDNFFNRKEIAYRFVDNYMKYHKLDKLNIKETINKVINVKRKEHEEKNKNDLALYKLSQWWLLDDQDIYTNLKLLEDDIVNGHYEISLYGSIGSLLANLISEGIDIKNLNEIEYAMLEKAKEHGEIVIEGIEYMDNKSANNYYLEIMTPIIHELNKKKNINFKASIVKCFEEKHNWGDKFSKFCSENSNIIFENRRLLEDVDIEIIKSAIKKSNTRNIYSFKNGLINAYNILRASNDKVEFNFIKNILKFLEEDKECYYYRGEPSITKKKAIKLLKDMLNNI